MEPRLVNEKMVSLFKFWMNEQINQGMACQGELFLHRWTFTVQWRQKAYALAQRFAQTGVVVIITVSATHYQIWTSLRSGGPSSLAEGVPEETGDPFRAEIEDFSMAC